MEASGDARRSQRFAQEIQSFGLDKLFAVRLVLQESFENL